jgi:ADP-heptose:LPS heptosyltransferase
MLGIPYPASTQLEMWPSPQDEEYIQNLMDAEWLGNVENIVGIHIAASQRWKTKNWPVEHIASLCDILSSKNIRVLLTGVDADSELTLQVVQQTKTKPAIFVGKTDILQLAALIQKCKVFITPDSAPMHIAAAMRVPFISFFGPTDPKRHLPPAERCVVLRRDLSCAPCYSTRCRILTHACMKEITPQEVAEQVEKFIRLRRRFPS